MIWPEKEKKDEKTTPTYNMRQRIKMKSQNEQNEDKSDITNQYNHHSQENRSLEVKPSSEEKRIENLEKKIVALEKAHFSILQLISGSDVHEDQHDTNSLTEIYIDGTTKVIRDCFTHFALCFKNYYSYSKFT